MIDEGRDEDAGRLAGAIASLLVMVTGVLVVVGVLGARPLTRLLAPGFVPGTPRFDLTVSLMRILTPGIGLLVLSAWCLGVLNAHRRFFLSYVAPVLWNVAIVVAVVVAAALGSGEMGLASALAVGALVGSLLQLLVQLPTVVRLSRGLRPRWRSGTAVPGLHGVLRAATGAIAGRGVVQVSAYLDLVVASLLAAGAVAALGYAQVLYLLPVSVFGMSVAAAALPGLATRVKRDAIEAAAATRDAVARVVYFVLPTALAYLIVGDHVVATLFEGGRFGPTVTRQVALVLGAYAIGLTATTVSRVLQATLHGADDTASPARVAALRVVVSTVCGVGLMLVLDAYAIAPEGIVRVDGFGLAGPAARAADDSLLRLGAVGLALGASIGAWLELALLRDRVRRLLPGAALADARLRSIVVAATVVVPGALVGRGLAAALTDLLVDPPALVVGPIAILPPALAYLAVTRRMGLAEADEVTRGLRRLIGRR
jgi:putative peptidoglycan lipid II flippase